MKRSIIGYIKHISLTNLIIPGIILAAMIALLILVPFGSIIHPEEASSIEEISALQADGKKQVKVTLTDLHYSGYDYYSKGKAVASYYYVLGDSEDSLCLFVLIPVSNTNGKADSINYYTSKTSVMGMDSTFETFLANFCGDIGWSQQGLTDACGGFYISEYDYSAVPAIILLVLVLLVALLCLAYIIQNLVCFFVPQVHTSCRRLKKFGLDSSDFNDIEEELEDHCLIHAGNMYVTDHYIVAFGRRNLWMVPLFNIVWAFKYSRWNILGFKVTLSYSLNLITSPKDRFFIHGNQKKHTDKILAFLQENFTHIAVGYSDEIRDKMKEVL